MPIFKVMTYNICSGHNLHGTRRLDETAEYIRSVNADIVGLNELDYRNKRSKKLEQIEFIRGRAGYQYCVFSPSIDFQGGYYGNGFLSRWPLAERKIIRIPYKTGSDSDRAEPRSILKAVVNAPFGPLTVLVTHYGLSVTERLPAVEATLKEAIASHYPVIFMGDLNATPDAEEMKPLFEFFNDTASAFDSKRLLSFDSGNPDIKIDYIFTMNEIKTKSVSIPAVQYSDHRPYIAELEL